MILSVHMTYRSIGLETFQDSGDVFDRLESHLGDVPGVEEYVVLRTCNRFEIYLGTNDGKGTKNELEKEFRRCMMYSEGAPPMYFLEGMDSIDHLFRVTSGMDSLIIGENQIQNQVKNSYISACEEGHVGTRMHRLFSRSLKVGKRTRTETGLCNGSVSVGSAAVSLAEDILGTLEDRTVTVIGAGEAATTLTKSLKGKKLRSFFVSNRTYERAMELAAQLGGSAMGLDMLAETIRQSHLVAVATSAPHPILTFDVVNEAVQGRTAPLVILDLSVPSNVEEGVGGIGCVTMARMEGLQQTALMNMNARRKEMKEAERILMEELDIWEHEELERDAVRTISQIGEKVSSIQRQEISKALRRVVNDNDVEEVFEDFSHALVSRIMADPITRLKEASREGRTDICDAARRLFDLEES